MITDSAGTIKSDSDYYSWGSELQLVNNDSNHYKFTRKERDAESDLDYFGARAERGMLEEGIALEGAIGSTKSDPEEPPL